MEEDNIDFSALPPPIKLSYTIHSYSGHTAQYTPSHIFVDSPSDQSSRWTGSSGVGSESLEDRSKVESRSSSPLNTNGSSSSGVKINSKRKETQYITLELEKPSLIKFIGFGKYHKVHPCNLAQFSIYGGLSPDPKHMEPLYHGGLRNDSLKERINLSSEECQIKGNGHVPLPVRYIRIDALAAHSQNYNVSIWHVWLEGLSDDRLMKKVLATYESYRTLKSSHLILSHLRRAALLSPFNSLLTSLPSTVSSTFEHPLITSLHTALVLQGNFSPPISLSSASPSSSSTILEDAESILEKCLSTKLLREWNASGNKGKSVARWEFLDHGDEFGLTSPSPRGGHQMVLVGRKILLFGGWDGQKDLDDLWEWDLSVEESEEGLSNGRISSWVKLQDDVVYSNGNFVKQKKPRARSCHQLAVDEIEGWVYLLGGMAPAITASTTPTAAIPIVSIDTPSDFVLSPAENDDMEVENGIPSSSIETPKVVENPFRNDFWRYKATGEGAGTWECLSEDVALQGGPRLLFDHEMIVHTEGRKLYVFGGKFENQKGNETGGSNLIYSGMYCYDLVKKNWDDLFKHSVNTNPETGQKIETISRMGNIMLLDTSSTPALYVFSGQRSSTSVSDLWRFQLQNSDPTTDADFLTPGTEAPGIIIKFSAKKLENDYTKGTNVPLGFSQRGSIDLETGEWTVISGLIQDRKTGNDICSEEIWIRSKEGVWKNVEIKGDKPKGRFAGPVLYDPIQKVHYMHGGNPQDVDRSKRLGDMWRLKIQQSSPEEALRQCKFLIRKQRFTEMCQTQSSLSALNYLQTKLSEVVDHTDELEASAFRTCMISLLSAPSSNNHDEDEIMNDSIQSSPNLSSSSEGEGEGEGEEEEDLSLSQFTSSLQPVPLTTSIPTTSILNPSTNNQQQLNSAQIQSATLISNPNYSIPDFNLYTQRQELFENLLNFFPENECQPKDDLRNMLCKRSE